MRPGLIFSATLAMAAVGAIALAATGDRLARLNVAEAQLSGEQARNMSQLARLLSVLEQLRRDPPPALLVSPQDAKDAVRAMILVKALTPELERRAQVYAREATEIVRQRRLAAVESEALFTNESARAEAAPEPAGGPPPLRSPAAAGGRMTPPRSLLIPVAGQLIRRFGEPMTGGGRSNGITWAALRGARVTSPAAGLVQYAGPVKGWGVILILRLSGGYHVVLAGLAQASVTIGQSVAPGQPVGSMPEGRQWPSELYLEVREQGAPVDPGRWIRN